MYFHVPEHIRLTYYNDNVIALNLRTNQYLFLPQNFSEFLSMTLTNEFVKINGKYFLKNTNTYLHGSFQYTLKLLQDRQLLSDLSYLDPYKNPPKKEKNSAGASNIDWRISHLDFNNKTSKKTILQAYWALLKVYFILKLFGIYSLIKAIKKKNKSNFKTKTSEDFAPLVCALNHACYYFPIRTKCLEWSAALVMMGLRNKWHCNLVIGAQLLPFRAHAWVKVGNDVIADDPNLPNVLSVILSEPL